MEKNHKGSENLKPFQKGNPGGGRPKGSVSLVTLIKKALDKKIDKCSTVADIVVAKLLARAMEGDIPAIKELLERIDGKVKQEVESSGQLTLIQQDIESARELARKRMIF